MNEKGLLGPSVSDGYTRLCRVGEFDLVGVFLPLRDGFLDLIHSGHLGDWRMILLVPFLTLLVLEASGDRLAHTHIS